MSCVSAETPTRLWNPDLSTRNQRLSIVSISFGRPSPRDSVVNQAQMCQLCSRVCVVLAQEGELINTEVTGRSSGSYPLLRRTASAPGVN